MTDPALQPGPLTRAALRLGGLVLPLLGVAAVLLAAGWMIQADAARIGFVVAGLTLLFLAGLVRLLVARAARARRVHAAALESLVEHDAVPCFATDADGALIYRNAAARARFEAADAQTLAAVLNGLFADPSGILNRLKNKAKALGSAQEDIVARRGHLRLSVHPVGGQELLWRVEEIAPRDPPGRSGETINLPMMIAARSGTILFMNEAMRRLLGARRTALDRVFTDLPVENGAVASVSAATGTVQMLVCEIGSSAGRREIYLLPEPQSRLVDPGEWDLVDTLPVPILKLERDGRIVMANRKARLLLEDEAPVGTMLTDQVEGAGRPISEWLRDIANGAPAGRSEVVRALRPEREVFLQISLEPVEEPDGRSLVAVLQDATELKTMEAQYLQSQKMQAIGQLAGGIAHDFNNLLTAISGHCDLLLLRHDETDQDFADLSQIHQNANRAATLVGQLLSFSRKQTLRPQTLDLAEALDDLTHLLNRLVGETVQLDLVQEPELLPIRADKRHLEQVLMNLVVNARDAMPEGGVIRIETRIVTLTSILKRDRATVPAGKYLVIKVIDQGIGIPQDRLERVFEPFYTTKGAGKGTGLGLSMAYGIVKQSGGFIFVDSTEGVGTTFTLYFPVVDEQARAQEAHPDAAPAAPVAGRARVKAEPDGSVSAPLVLTEPAHVPAESGGPRALTRGNGAAPRTAQDNPPPHDGVVLLVEDEAPVRAFASRALRMRGFTVIEADSAETALEMLDDDSLAVDIFVTDVIMPGMDGPTWVARALETRPQVKVVFVSGYSEDSISEHQARIPNSVFLPKPFSLSQLTRTVQSQLS